MKRKNIDINEDEKRLSKILFHNQSDFAENIVSKSKNEDLSKDTACPVWTDEDDDNSTIKKKYSHENELYIKTLKQKYTNLMGTPNWAKLDNNRTEEGEVIKTVGHLKKVRSVGLPQNLLEFRNFPKINAVTKGKEGPIINTILFHPTSSVALVGGQSGRISLFSIGSDTNEKLHNFYLKKAPVLTAHFTPNGTEAYISLKESHKYCVYDLMKAESKLEQLPRIVKKLKIFELSRDGKYLAVADGFDEVSIICTKSKELIRMLKHNFNVVSLSFNSTNDKIYTLGVSGEITVWNLSTFRVESRFYDEGCVGGSCIVNSPCGKLLSVGSNEGIVNIYETSKISGSNPIPTKTINNLVTKITNMKFNCSSEILAISSSYYPNAVKLVHIPSFKVFQNFPTPGLNIHQVGPIAFSPNSGYLGIGNNKKCAYLYRLKYFKNY